MGLNSKTSSGSAERKIGPYGVYCSGSQHEGGAPPQDHQITLRGHETKIIIICFNIFLLCYTFLRVNEVLHYFTHLRLKQNK